MFIIDGVIPLVYTIRSVEMTVLGLSVLGCFNGVFHTADDAWPFGLLFKLLSLYAR